MAASTVRNLPDETLPALKLPATKAGRSTEAEIREILANAVGVGVGSALANIGRKLGGVDLDAKQNRGVIKAAGFD